jgi:hypothetical protein
MTTHHPLKPTLSTSTERLDRSRYAKDPSDAPSNAPNHAPIVAQLLNRYLKPQGTIAKVLQRDRRLQVLLESIDVPQRERLLPWIKQAIEAMRLQPVDVVQIFARRAGDQNCAWTETYVVRSHKLMAMDSYAMAQQQRHQQPTDPAEIIRRSQGGDVASITFFTDQALNNPNLRTHVELEQGVLKITIETIQYLDGQNFAVELAQKLRPIASPKVHTVEIYKRKTATSSSALLNRIELLSAVR